ncbi:branched-chain amino acid ABC transporter permease [Ramlibacter sp. AN1133]|uniref:branched-chain amino acid ABC transporter permease n=1 Tax=Ramlibacter sp. AN1133 TaxID=3133429 RepID=UPI0030BC8EB6
MLRELSLVHLAELTHSAKAKSWRVSLPCALFLLLLALPLTNSDYIVSLGSRVLIFSILAVSLDLILGFGGLISFGHAAYFGAGAYTVAALIFAGSGNGLVHLISAMAVSGTMALVIGLLCARSDGLHFIMLTFAFAQMAYFIASGLQRFGGDDGATLPSRSNLMPLDLADRTHFYYLAWACLAVVLVVCVLLVRSRFGMALRASKQNGVRLSTLGIPSYPYRVLAFGIAGAFAGLAGFLMVNLNAYVSPNFFAWKLSGDVIMMVVIGGVGTLAGGVVGAGVFLLLQEVLSAFTPHWMFYLGPLLVVIALYGRRGLVGLLRGERK